MYCSARVIASFSSIREGADDVPLIGAQASAPCMKNRSRSRTQARTLYRFLDACIATCFLKRGPGVESLTVRTSGGGWMRFATLAGTIARCTSVTMSAIGGTGDAGPGCSCRADLGISRRRGRGVTGVDGSSTGDFDFLKRSGWGVVAIGGGVTGRDTSPPNSPGVLIRVEGADCGRDGSSLTNPGLLIDTIAGGVEPRREGSSELRRRARRGWSIGDGSPASK